jgi:uncharacterized protein
MLKPLDTKERIKAVDVLRGFSLIGILIVNILAFIVPMPHVSNISAWFTNIKDIMLYQYIEIYVQSSFYPLFAMLFGFGFAIQFQRAMDNAYPFYKFGVKRIVVLFIIGLLHAFLLWWGDILVTYAFCATFVLMLIRLHPAVILLIAVILNAFMHSYYLLAYSTYGVLNELIPESVYDVQAINDTVNAYTRGSYADAFSQRLIDLSIQLNSFTLFISLLTILPYMLVGVVLSKWGILQKIKHHRTLFLVLSFILMGVGIFIKNAPFVYGETYLLSYMQVYIGGPILAIGYIFIVTWLCTFKWTEKVLQPFEQMGRMSLSLYIMQTVILTTLFYHYGFGLYGKIDIATSLYVVAAIIVFQMLLAYLWLLKWKQGPLELLMKKIIYKK